MQIKKTICLLSSLLLSFGLWSQTTLFSEDFNNGCTSLCLANTYPGWSIAATGSNGAFANNWFISCAENGNAPGTCGAGCGNNATLHVGSVAGSPGGLCPTGDCGAAYDASLASVITNRRVESPVVDCSGYSSIVVQYNYIGAQTDLPLDGYTFVYSSNGGTTWTNLGNGPASACCCSAIDCFFGCCPPTTTTCGGLRQGNWGQVILGLPASASNNPNVRVGFNWTNNGDNIGTDPSVAIDDLQVLGDLVLYDQIHRFSGYLNEKGALLTWEIDEEKVHQVALERSLDGLLFEPIASFTSADGSMTPNLHQYRDESFPGNRSFYRLLTWDSWGTRQYSQVLELSKAPVEKITFFPNPVSSSQQLHLDVVVEEAQTILVEMIDLKGRLVLRKSYTLEMGSHGLALPMESVETGVFILRTRLGREWKNGKVVVY